MRVSPPPDKVLLEEADLSFVEALVWDLVTGPGDTMASADTDISANILCYKKKLQL